LEYLRARADRQAVVREAIEIHQSLTGWQKHYADLQDEPLKTQVDSRLLIVPSGPEQQWWLLMNPVAEARHHHWMHMDGG
jgi:hypothetical protein